MSNVIGYLRVSTEEQGRSGLGLIAQKRAIAREWRDVQWITDDNHTASNLKRPGIAQALRLLADGEADTLVVARLDRLSRSVLDFAGLMDTALRQGWAIVVLDLGVDMRTPQGKFVATVMASFAELERELIRQRTRDALQAKKARGHRLGRKVALPTRTRNLIARLRADGLSYKAIATELNRRRIKTAHQGAKWYGETVRGVCKSLELDDEMNEIRADRKSA